MIFCKYDEAKKDFKNVKMSSEAAKIYARFDNKNRLVTVEEETNNLRISNMKKNKVTEFSGNIEEVYSKPVYLNKKSSRSSGISGMPRKTATQFGEEASIASSCSIPTPTRSSKSLATSGQRIISQCT